MMDNNYSLNEAKEEIKHSIMLYLAKDEAGNYLLEQYKKNPFFLIGPPGIGKTQAARQIAEELGIGFFATSVTHHTRNSVLGLPVITQLGSEKVTEYTMPDILSQVEKRCDEGQKEGILLIDEFASMSESLVAPMLAFLQSKCIGNHYLPEGWIMLLCSNPPEYNETSREFDAVIMDRVRLMNIVFSKEDFLNYAQNIGMHSAILGFLKTNSKYMYLCEAADKEKEVVTARGWENLSDCLYGYEKSGWSVSEKLIYQFIKSHEAAHEFYNFYALTAAGLDFSDIDRIIDGKNIKKYAHKYSRLSFEKKWQLRNVLLEVLFEKCKASAQKGRFIRYMDKWTSEWRGKLKKRKLDELQKSSVYSDFITVIQHRIDWTDKNEIYLRSGHNYIPSIFADTQADDFEKEQLKKILDRINVMNFGENEPGKIVDVMEKYIDDMRKKADGELAVSNAGIENTILFINSLDMADFAEIFFRELNCNEDILFVVSVSANKAYQEMLDKIYGEAQ